MAIGEHKSNITELYEFGSSECTGRHCSSHEHGHAFIITYCDDKSHARVARPSCESDLIPDWD